VANSPAHAPNVVCLASYFKGVEFLRECKRRGARVVLLTREKRLGEEWPREELDEVIAVPDDAGVELFIHAVSQIARDRPVDCLVALEEYDILTAALIREHLRLPGIGYTAACLFRDKLAMRVRAREKGIRAPDFVHPLNHDALRQFMERVPPPWVLKPRSDVSAMGIKKLDEPEQVWRALDTLDARPSLVERSSYHLLEQFVAGEVFHVDSLVVGGRVAFAGVSRYGRPPLEVAHQGGTFISHTVEYDSADEMALREINEGLIAALGLDRGAAHAEFIKSGQDGQLYFLEIAARVGGAFIAETLEAASGINLWREWARVELAALAGEEYAPRPPRREYAGIVLSLARQESPDTSGYADAEIVHRVKKPHHVGLIVRAPEPARVRRLLDEYARRFLDEFCAVVAPLERPQ